MAKRKRQKAKRVRQKKVADVLASMGSEPPLEVPEYVKCSFTRLVRFEGIKFNPKNRNLHPPEQLDRLAKILKYQGIRRCPTTSNQSGLLTVGEGRIMAAHTRLGWDVFPMDFQNYTDADQEYADMVADNAMDDWSSLDLSGINADLGDLGPDLDLDMLGIKDFEMEPADKYANRDADSVPEDVPAKSKVGDLWLLGAYLQCDKCKTEFPYEKTKVDKECPKCSG